MRVLIAPAPFKGSLSSGAAADAIARGLRTGFPERATVRSPLADGGEGTLAVLRRALGGELQFVRVADPLGRTVTAELGWLPDGVAVVEMAEAAGLARLSPSERDPLRASTYGVGQLMGAALDAGAREIWIALGGSATVDGGLGLLQALGVRLTDAEGREVPRGGRGLRKLATLDPTGLDPRLDRVTLRALCDVDSPLLGPQGAPLFMAQKGATTQGIEALSAGLARFADRAERAFGREVRSLSGSGAAGGLGAALALLGAELTSGARFVLDALAIDDELARCDLVLTGEGQIDAQTLRGKAVGALAERARAHGRPVVALCGAYAGSLAALRALGLAAVLPIGRGPATLADALASAEADLAATAESLAGLLRALGS